MLDGISLTIHAGEHIAIIGPSGAGKTSLLAVLAQAVDAHSGSVCIAGNKVSHLNTAQRHALRKTTFYAPQTPPLPPRQRVVNAVLAGRLPLLGAWQSVVQWFRTSPAEPVYTAFAKLELLGLGDKLWANVATLSGGERQRVGLARMLVSQVQTFLVDEPLSALDPARAEAVIQVLKTEASTRGATLVCSLHQVDLARRQFERVIGLREGKLVFDCAANALTDAAVAALYAGLPAESAPNIDEQFALNDSTPVLVRCN